MAISQNMPTQTTPFLTTNGRISHIWWRFLLALFNRTGGMTGGSVGPLEAVVLGTSPYSFVAQQLGALIISGQGVAKTEFSRDGVVFLDTGTHYGSFMMALNDIIRITYVSPHPTVTFAPMALT